MFEINVEYYHKVTTTTKKNVVQAFAVLYIVVVGYGV